jgi:hypothetical protein
MGPLTQEQIAQYTGWLQEWSSSRLGPGYQVTHRYFGYDLPYRWEIRSHEPRWRWTLALRHADVAQLRGLSESLQRELLCSRAEQVVGN